MHVNLVQPRTGQVKQVKVGFSWTVFFFGFFPALFRGDIKWALIIFFVNILTVDLSNIVFMFIYNRIYINGLLEKGYIPASETDSQILISKNFIASPIYQDSDDDFDF